jgi:hypothetical protein
VVFAVGTIVLSVLVVVCTRGSFERLGRIKLHALWLLLVALVAQLALEFVDFPEARLDDLGFGLLLATYVLVFAFCFLNRTTSGMWIVTVGVALNVLVIALNQGMPTKDDVVERNGRAVHEPIEHTVKHRPQEDDDRLSFLGDVLSAPGIPNQQFSIGDVIIGLGVADICFEASRRPRRRGAYLEPTPEIAAS